MSAVLVLIMAVPLGATLVSWWAAPRLAGLVTVLAGTATFGLAVALVPSVARYSHGTGAVGALGNWLRVDSLSLVFLLATAFLYCLTAIFSVGYAGADRAASRVYRRRLFAGLNLFAWAMAMAPMVNDLGLLWVAIEVTTVASALLVAIEGTDGAIEAAWKYILIASLGLGLSLLATAFIYHAGSFSLGHSYDLSYTKLLGHASVFPAATVRLAYLLAVVGYGTKMGLFPVHTWLPDAHSEAPTPVSALLSGSLLATSFYAILRYYQITERAAGAAFARDVLAGFGVLTLLLGALYLASQRDLKRLLAYSSIEHMGILAIGVSFASPLAIAGPSCTSSPMPPPRGRPSSGPGAWPASCGPRTWRGSGVASAFCPGRARCWWQACWGCRPCRLSGRSAPSFRSSPEASPGVPAPTPPKRPLLP